MKMRNRRDPFEAAKEAFLLRAARDQKAGASALRVAIVLATRYANRRTFDAEGLLQAWPGQRAIRDDLDCFKGRVADGIARLVERGHLAVEKAGRGQRYTLVFEASDTSDCPANPGQSEETTAPEIVDSHRAIDCPANPGQLKPRLPRKSGARPPRISGANLIEEPPDTAGAPLGARLPDTSVGNQSAEFSDAVELDGRAPDGAPVNPGGLHVPPSIAAEYDEPVTLADLDRQAAEEQAAAVGRGDDAPACTADPLTALGLSGEDLGPLRDAFAAVAMDAAHKMTADAFGAGFVHGFVYEDTFEADQIVADTTHVLGRLAGLDDELATTVDEHVEALCGSLRPLAGRIDPERADAAVAAFLEQIGHEMPAPVVADPAGDPLMIAAPLVRDPIDTAGVALAALFGARMLRPGDLAGDLAAGLGPAADPDALARAVAAVRAVAVPGDWPVLVAIVDEIVGLDGGADLLGAVSEVELKEAENG